MDVKSAPIDDELVECPYQSHMVAQRRFIQHLTKCEKHPNSRKLDKCPYNVQHRIAPELMAAHMAECPSSRIFIRELGAQASEPVPWVSTDVRGDTEENDDDPWNAPHDRKPFIAPGLGPNKNNKGARRPDGSINPLIYQAMTPAERRKLNQEQVDFISGSTSKAGTTKPYPGMGRGKRS